MVNIGTGSWIASYEMNCRHNLVALQYMSPSALSCVNQLYGSVALEASRSTGLNALNHIQSLSSNQDDVSKMNLSCS